MGVKDERLRYVIVHFGPMEELELTVGEYALAAMIHNLSHRGKYGGWCIASREYFAKNLRVNRSTVKRHLARLEELELVECDEGTHYLRTTEKWYQATVLDDAPGGGKMHQGKMHQDGAESAQEGGNLHPNNESNNLPSSQKSGGVSKRFQPPTMDEVKQYMEQYAMQKGMDFSACMALAERLWNFYQSNGWKVGKNPMKDWQATVRKWVGDEKDKLASKQGRHEKAANGQQLGFSLFSNPNQDQ